MKINNGTPSVALLALLISSSALANAERPQLKDYSSYTDFLRAVVDYTKNDGEMPASEQQCRDGESSEGGSSVEKKNACNQKEVTTEARLLDTGAANGSDTDPMIDGSASAEGSDELDGLSGAEGADQAGLAEMDSADMGDPDSAGVAASAGGSGPAGDQASNATGDSLEQAIDLARDGLNPVYVDPSNTRTTFSSFPMEPIDSGDLAQVSLIDALSGLTMSTRDPRIRLNINPSNLTNPAAVADARQGAEDYELALEPFAVQQELLATYLNFDNNNFVWTTDGNYYSIVYANPAYIGEDGVRLEFSSQSSVRVAIVDSDGFTGSRSAGAVVIDPLNIKTNTIVASLFAVEDNGEPGLLAKVDITDGIEIDLGNTKVGVATATRNSDGGWNIGRVKNFLYFGADSKLSILMESPMEVLVTNPTNGTNTPLMRLNASIDHISLSEIALLDSTDGNGVHFGRVTMSNIQMINTAVYFENDTIRVDMGKGADNLRMAIENIVLGGSLQDRANGNLPPSIGDVEVSLSTKDNMQITLRSH
ncbi:MAG: hypothetical protein Q7T32_12510 [Moraxellaceae bacterium]|nr:hypothetical protein [Moraxellaceae bacterium]